jgi:hypothetical protein
MQNHFFLLFFKKNGYFFFFYNIISLINFFKEQNMKSLVIKGAKQAGILAVNITYFFAVLFVLISLLELVNTYIL